MLLVQTDLARSPIEGLGLFTRRPILAGVPVWRFDPAFDVMLPTEVVRRCDPEFIARYTSQCPRTGRRLVCSDDARFINHADVPSLVYADAACNELVAARDLAAGEELTCNYAVDDADPWGGFGTGSAGMSASKYHAPPI